MILLGSRGHILCLAFYSDYRTGANKGRGLYSKKILWSIGAAYKQERLQLKKNFLKKNQSFNSQNLL